jgi:UDP-sugar transporter A1/2/3
MLSFKKLTKKMSSANSSSSSLLKFTALAVLVLQNALLVLVMRYSQLIPRKPDEPLYLASTAVFMGEALKLIGSILLIYKESAFRLNETVQTVSQHLIVLSQPKELFNLSVPALLYVVQNNLAYVATAHLDPAPYQLLYQLKIFTTAVLSIMLLKRVLGSAHWKALGVLFVGVIIVQLSTMETKEKKKDAEQNPLLGLAAILVAVTCSGLSGVWFERILKSSSVSVWIRNMQLALISLILAGISVYTKDYDQATKHGFFYGYSPTVWAVIILQGGGGLIVALVVKYADNILKGFATSIATVFSTVASVIWFDFQVSPLFLIGAVLVLGSAYMYNVADMAPKPASVQPPTLAEAESLKVDSVEANQTEKVNRN